MNETASMIGAGVATPSCQEKEVHGEEHSPPAVVRMGFPCRHTTLSENCGHFVLASVCADKKKEGPLPPNPTPPRFLFNTAL